MTEMHLSIESSIKVFMKIYLDAIQNQFLIVSIITLYTKTASLIQYIKGLDGQFFVRMCNKWGFFDRYPCQWVFSGFSILRRWHALVLIHIHWYQCNDINAMYSHYTSSHPNCPEKLKLISTGKRDAWVNSTTNNQDPIKVPGVVSISKSCNHQVDTWQPRNRGILSNIHTVYK